MITEVLAGTDTVLPATTQPGGADAETVHNGEVSVSRNGGITAVPVGVVVKQTVQGAEPKHALPEAASFALLLPSVVLLPSSW